jgi:phospholipase C
VKHVFEIVLDEHGFTEAFGPTSSATYLAKTLTGQGELLNNYYSVAGGALANEIALISGQGPTAQTVANCPAFTDITPGTIGAEGQVAGTGCVYPAQAPTLAGELTSAGKSWKAYVEGIGSGAPGEAATCRHPALESSDPDHTATPTDPYVTWRNPFVYFHSLIDGDACSKQDVGLDQLAPDLKKAADTPSLAYIVPDRCHDGSEQPCTPGAPDGLAAADSFLQTVVPQIKRSAAYKEGGLIVITFDQAPQSGPSADPRACCETPKYPNLLASPTGAATGATGTSATGATGTALTTETTTTTTPEPGGGETTPTGGGGRVGLLLISPYVKAGSTSEVYYDHFSLLLSIEELFNLKRIGYTANPALVSFGRAIYNAPVGKG